MPRRHDQLFARIANFQALHAAARRAIKGKRKKPGAAAFFANLEGELLALERQLRDGEISAWPLCRVRGQRPEKADRLGGAVSRPRRASCALRRRGADLRRRLHRPHVRQPDRQRHAPRDRGLRALSRPPRPCAALRHLPLFSGDRSRDPEVGLPPPHRVARRRWRCWT